MLLKLYYNKNLEGKFTENGLFVLNYVNGFEMNYFVMCSLRDPEFQYFVSCLQASTFAWDSGSDLMSDGIDSLITLLACF